jgi:hypothetical protein
MAGGGVASAAAGVATGEKSMLFRHRAMAVPPVASRRKKRSRATIATLLAVGGCGSNAPATGVGLNQSITPADVDQDRARWECVSQEATRLVEDGTAGKPDYPNDYKIADLALQRCAAISKSIFGPSLDRVRADTLVIEAATAKEQAQVDRIRRREAQQAAENEAALKAAEPLAVAKWGACLRASVKGVALTTMEPASTVVMVAIAACKPQWRELEQLHARYGDPGFATSATSDIEQRITGSLMLQVVAARAARQAVPPQRPARPSDGPI